MDTDKRIKKICVNLCESVADERVSRPMKSEKQRKSKCPAGTGPAVCGTRHVTGKTGHAARRTRHVTVETWIVTAETWIAGVETWIAGAEK